MWMFFMGYPLIVTENTKYALKVANPESRWPPEGLMIMTPQRPSYALKITIHSVSA
jgi:hypothetical protein